jgi:MATE family multidrug resistance protein
MLPRVRASDGSASAPTAVAEVLRLTGPAVLTSLLQTLAFLADRIMLARHSEVALGSMQISGSIMWSVFSVFFGAMVGTVALISRRVGAGELERARIVARSALRAAGAIGLAVGLVGSVSAGFIAHAMAPGEPEIADTATAYMRIGFLGFPAAFVGTAGALILNGSGDTKSTFWIGMLANLVNIGANYLLIYGATIGTPIGPIEIPELGAAGAAIATALNYVVQCSLVLWVLRRGGCPVRVERLLGPNASDPGGERGRVATRELFRLSSPAVAERLVIHVGYVVFAALVTSLGATAMAAHQALLTLESICFLGAEGFGIAAATVVGQFLGRGDPDGSTRGGASAAMACAFALTGCGLAIWITAGTTLPMFVAPGESGTDMIAAASRTLPFLALAQPMMALAVVLGHGLRGAGDIRSPLIAAVIGGLLVRVSGAWILAFELGLGLPGIWMATALDWTVRTAILGHVFLRGRWRSVDL